MEFLDVNHCIIIEDDFVFVTKHFVKPTAEGRQPIDGNSHYPKATIKLILFGEAISLRCFNQSRLPFIFSVIKFLPKLPKTLKFGRYTLQLLQTIPNKIL